MNTSLFIYRGHGLLAITFLLATLPDATAQVETTPESFPDAETYIYRDLKPQPLRLFVIKPTGWRTNSSLPAFVHFFGGAWTRGNPEKSIGWARMAARWGMIGIAPDYRTTERFGSTPVEAVADARLAVRWIEDHAKELGVDINRIVVSGSSAGGHLALWTGIDKPPFGSTLDESPSTKPAALVLVSTPASTTVADWKDNPRLVQRFGPHIEDVSPLQHLDTKMPPVIMFHGDADSTVPYRIAVALHDHLVADGNVCEFITMPGGGHGIAPDWKDKSRDLIKQFLTKQGLLPATLPSILFAEMDFRMASSHKTHPQPLLGGEQTNVRLQIVPLLGGVRGGAFQEIDFGNRSNTAATTQPTEVLKAMERIADWQLANPSTDRKPTDWTQAALYTGIMALSQISTNAKYENAMLAMGTTNGWKLAERKFHADDHCVGQTYVELFLRHRDPGMIKPMQSQFDDILAHPSKVDSLEFTQPDKRARELWSWCDALFMSPPAWLKLWSVTQDARYRDFAVTNWWRTSDYLYDTNEHLYLRDSTFFEKREANGKKIFWSRGNGWVMAGHARMLQILPADDPARAQFVSQFREMAAKVLACQQSDGLWRASLLDPESYPIKETSGSAFFTYAFAWGLNQGLLDRKQFEPAVTKAWNALMACVQSDGKLTHVQPIGLDPKHFDENSTHAYGVGAVLLAGSEVYQMTQTNTEAARIRQ